MQGGRKGLLCCCCLPFSFSSPTFDISGKSKTTPKKGYTKVTTIARWERGRGDYRGARISINWAKHTFQRRFFKDL